MALNHMTAQKLMYSLYTILTFRPGPSKSRIHECTILLRFLDIILRVLRLEVSVCNVYITNQFQITSARGGGGGGVKSVSRGDWE